MSIRGGCTGSTTWTWVRCSCASPPRIERSREAQSAHAECVGALARRARETAATGEWVESVRAWKALLLINALLNRKDADDRAPGGKARPQAAAPSKVVSDRLKSAWKGEWADLWNAADQANQAPPATKPADAGIPGPAMGVDSAAARQVRKAREFLATVRPLQALRALRQRGELATGRGASVLSSGSCRRRAP